MCLILDGRVFAVAVPAAEGGRSVIGGETLATAGCFRRG